MTVTQPTFPTGSNLDERFDAFHQTHPRVYAELVRLTGQAIDRGAQRVSVKRLIEDLRYGWDERTGPWVRIDNSYSSRYARLLVAQHPEWADRFELRRLAT